MLKKVWLDQCDVVDIPDGGIVSNQYEDPNGTPVDPTRYRGMVGSLMYLLASLPDLVFVVYMCARYQTKPTEKHLTTVKRVFRYLKGTINKIPIILIHSKSAIANILPQRETKHSRTKHIDVRYHFTKEQVENDVVELYFVETNFQLVDIFTKAHARERFKFLINCLSMQSITPKEQKRHAESDEE
ncbi:hypothetical protein Tco_1385514 [Tanacetum coccineum]